MAEPLLWSHQRGQSPPVSHYHERGQRLWAQPCSCSTPRLAVDFICPAAPPAHLSVSKPQHDSIVFQPGQTCVENIPAWLDLAGGGLSLETPLCKQRHGDGGKCGSVHIFTLNLGWNRSHFLPWTSKMFPCFPFKCSYLESVTEALCLTILCLENLVCLYLGIYSQI